MKTCKNNEIHETTNIWKNTITNDKTNNTNKNIVGTIITTTNTYIKQHETHKTITTHKTTQTQHAYKQTQQTKKQ